MSEQSVSNRYNDLVRDLEGGQSTTAQQPYRSRSSFKTKAWTLIGIFISLGLISAATGFILLNRDDTKTDQTASQDIESPNINPNNNLPPVEAPLLTPPVTPSPILEPAPVPPIQPPTTFAYTNETWKFSFVEAQQVLAHPVSGHQIVFQSATDATIYGTVAYHSNPPVKTLTELRAHLSSNQNYLNFSNTTFGDKEALRFDQTNGTQTVAVFHNGILYYIAGPLTENLTFRFF